MLSQKLTLGPLRSTHAIRPFAAPCIAARRVAMAAAAVEAPEQKEGDEPKKLYRDMVKELTVGSVMPAKVKSIEPWGALVTIGEVNAVLHVSKISTQKLESAAQCLTPGEELKVLVVYVDKQKGKVSVSTREFEKQPGDILTNKAAAMEGAEEGAKKWRQVNEALKKERKRARQQGKTVEEVRAEREKKEGEKSAWQKRGKVDRSAKPKRERKERPLMTVGVGDLENATPSQKEAAIKVLQKYKVGQLLEGAVQNVSPAGVFVDLARGVRGTLIRSQVSRSITSAEVLPDLFKKGDMIKVVVHELDEEKGQIRLSTRQLEPKKGDMLRDPKLVYEKADEMYALWKAQEEQLAAKAAGKGNGGGSGGDGEGSNAGKGEKKEWVVYGVTSLENASPSQKQAAAKVLGRFKAGQLLEGAVQNVTAAGVFVDLGRNVRGLLARKWISSMFPKDDSLPALFSKGDMIKVVVRYVDEEKCQIKLTTKPLEPKQGDMLRDPDLVFEKADEMYAKWRTEQEKEAEKGGSEEGGRSEGPEKKGPAKAKAEAVAGGGSADSK